MNIDFFTGDSPLTSSGAHILIVGETDAADGAETALLRHAGFDGLVRLPAPAAAEDVTRLCRSCAPLVVLLIARTAEDAVGLADAVLRAGMSQPPAMLAILQKG
ncbi:MAG: hypothetical protein RLY86_4033, partial [Pseudomonadota bacterium]